jgi:hypothetical protein
LTRLIKQKVLKKGSEDVTELAKESRQGLFLLAGIRTVALLKGSLAKLHDQSEF